MAELTFEQFLAETKESEKRREAKENVLIKKETKTFNELQEKLDMFDELTASKEQIEDAELTKAQITQIQEDRKYREEENKNQLVLIANALLQHRGFPGVGFGVFLVEKHLKLGGGLHELSQQQDDFKMLAISAEILKRIIE